jgi:hypothetical protein
MLIQVFEAGPVATNGYLVAIRPRAMLIMMLRRWRIVEQAAMELAGSPIQSPRALGSFRDNAVILRLTNAKFGIHPTARRCLDSAGEDVWHSGRD